MTTLADSWKALFSCTICLLPELLLVVVGWGGEGGWNIYSFRSLSDGSDQQILCFSPERDVKWLWDEAFGHYKTGVQ